MDYEKYMRMALELAADAEDHGDVPVGCVIVDSGGRVVGIGQNRREEHKTALGHAEMEAIGNACRSLNSWRLLDCILYVTLEPCPMCAGAIINARIPKVFYGAKDEKAGACGSVLNLFEENFNHKPQLIGGILEDECAAILSSFFRKMRG